MTRYERHPASEKMLRQITTEAVNLLALACAMSAGVWRFGAEDGQPTEDRQTQRKKTDRKRAER